MEAPSFDVHREESSHQHLIEGSHLDVRQAELLLQHVRALNRQFASWVQSQLQNHLDELWEDGVKDYMSHASNIMEEFKDIVAWLRVNAVTSQSNLSTSPSNGRDADNIPQTGLASPNVAKPLSFSLPASACKQTSVSLSDQGNSIFTSNITEFNWSPATKLASSEKVTPSFALPQTSSLFFNSQSWFNSGANNGSPKEATSASLPLMQSSGSVPSSQMLGLFSMSGTQSTNFPCNQNSTLEEEEPGDTDNEDELEQPNSPSLKKAEEKGVSTVHEANCKVYLKTDNHVENGWKDMGIGHLSIKCKEGAEKASRESRPTIIVRNDAGRILLNALIYPGIKMTLQKNSIISIFHTSSDGQGSSSEAVARTYLIRLKSVEDTTKLAETIKEYAPSA